MTLTEIYIVSWAILGMIAVAILLCTRSVGINAEGKITIDVALAVLIIVLVSARLRRK